MMNEKSKYQKAEAKALRKIVDENMASIPKGFEAVDPKNMDMAIGPGPRIYYPEFHLTLKDIPEAKNWEVGSRYTLELVVEMTGMTDRIGQKASVDFSIIGIKPGKYVEIPESAKKAEKEVEDKEESEDDSEDDE